MGFQSIICERIHTLRSTPGRPLTEQKRSSRVIGQTTASIAAVSCSQNRKSCPWLLEPSVGTMGYMESCVGFCPLTSGGACHTIEHNGRVNGCSLELVKRLEYKTSSLIAALMLVKAMLMEKGMSDKRQ